MSGTRSLLLVCALAGCGRIAFDAPASVGDGGPDALGPFSAVQSLPGANDPTLDEEDISFSSSTLEAFFTVGPDEGPKGLYTMTRGSTTSSWSAPAQVAALDTSNWNAGPRLSSDDREIFFTSDRDGLSLDIWRATRASATGQWTNTAEVAETKTEYGEFWFAPCDGGRYVIARETDIFALYQGVLGGGPPTKIDELDTTPDGRSGPFLSRDCLTLYYSSYERGDGDLFVTHRATPTSTWDPPTPLDEFNLPDADDADPWISPDGRTFAFSSTRGESTDVYFATR